ncbi:hypothetical protein MTR67_019843 [Solanum verrucosum]|uniref:Uncharacterized protein n=1 Tax=Solanum verrucosum TaxID=315347 RepID=A0AAF0QNL2_SOLVR|nr:hypothetical protein MTR67_019843 [Solanum verrucosum]
MNSEFQAGGRYSYFTGVGSSPGTALPYGLNQFNCRIMEKIIAKEKEAKKNKEAMKEVVNLIVLNKRWRKLLIYRNKTTQRLVMMRFTEWP